MIQIKVSKGVPYVWEPQDWLKLREEHRILGTLDGAVTSGLSGRMRWNLPMRLSSVEVQFLISQGIATTVHAPSLYEDPQEISQEMVDAIKEKRTTEQLEAFKIKRKADIETFFDKMLEGKRRKGKSFDEIDKESFIKNELNKIRKSPYEMYQLELGDPWLTNEDYFPFDFPIPQSYVERLKFKVFEDFHLHKKYWISPGIKFGGDFLAYPGDPRNFHAEYIIMCPDKNFLVEEYFASQCRLALTVKKTLLIAKLDEDMGKLMYLLSNNRIEKNHVS